MTNEELRKRNAEWLRKKWKEFLKRQESKSAEQRKH